MTISNQVLIAVPLIIWIVLVLFIIMEYGYKRFKRIAADISVGRKLAVAIILGPLGLCLFLYFLYLDLVEAIIGVTS